MPFALGKMGAGFGGLGAAAGRGGVYPIPKFKAALAAMAAGTRNVNMLFLGDSTFRGLNTSAGTSAQIQAFPMQLAPLLTAAGYIASANNWLGRGAMVTSTSDNRLSLTGWVATASGSLAETILGVSSAGTVVYTPQTNCDTFRIIYPLVTGAGRSFTANLNGGSTLATITNTAGAAAIGETTVSGSIGANALNLVWVSGQVFASQLICWDSTLGKQILILNAGWSGAEMSAFQTADLPFRAFPMINYLAPDLAILGGPINEWEAGKTVAAYTDALRAVIAQAQLTGDVVLTTPVPSSTAVATVAVQQGFVAAIWALSRELRLRVVPIFEAFGSYAAANAAGLMSDTKHPSQAGYALMAQLTRSVILR